jgi:hypothetical protein
VGDNIDLWARAHAHKPALTFSDGDLLITATAIAHGRALVTVDEKLRTLLKRLNLQATLHEIPISYARGSHATGGDVSGVWKALFPEGMTFIPVTVGRRHVWRARANARFGAISQSTLDGDPSGSLSNLRLAVPVELVAARAA